MTNKKMLKIALEQSAIDSSCSAQDFLSSENKVVISKTNENARKYLQLPFICDLTSYGSNIVASVSPDLQDVVGDFISKHPIEHCFETPNLHLLIEKLKPFNANVCFMAEYFLPDVDNMPNLSCEYETKILTAKDFANLYTPEWSNALCIKRKQLDVLGVAAYENNELIGLAGCSADCDDMWQIGIDVLPQYRKKGIASTLTNRLALEILSREKVPFYCCAWANIKSIRNSIKAGFKPAWVQLTIKENSFIEQINS